MDIETNTQIKEVRDTIVILRELNADEKVKQEAYYREKRLHDEASALGCDYESLTEDEFNMYSEAGEKLKEKMLRMAIYL